MHIFSYSLQSLSYKHDSQAEHISLSISSGAFEYAHAFLLEQDLGLNPCIASVSALLYCRSQPEMPTREVCSQQQEDPSENDSLKVSWHILKKGTKIAV